MAKFTHHISYPVGVLTAGEQRGTEWKNKALVSPSFPLALPTLPSSHPVLALLTPSPLPSLFPPRSIERLLSEWKEAQRRRPTLTQLVRLMKRICGLWVGAQTH